MQRQHGRSKRLKITMSPEITCNLSHEQRASDLVYFLVIDTCGYQIFCCVSVGPRLTDWKFDRDQFCRGFWKGQTNFVSPVRPEPYPYHIIIGRAVVASWWEHSSPANVARVRFPNSAWYSGWVCWFPQYSALRGFSPGTPVLPSPKKSAFT